MRISPFIARVLVITCLVALSLGAANKNRIGGPKGGRLLETEPKAEFFVEKDHTAIIVFYDGALKPLPATEQSATVIADSGGGKNRVEFEKKGDILVSKSRLPEGGDYNVVVQLKQKPDAKPQNFRFELDLKTCGECKRAEYACICDE